MPQTTDWKIWYDNGKTFSSEDGPADEAPLDGVQVIVEKRSDRDSIVHQGRDYYFWNGENWVSGDIGSLEKWLRDVLPNLKHGRWSKDSIFEKAMEEVRDW